MRFISISFICVFAQFCVFSQNLVPNPSFEDTVSCPNFVGQIDKAVGWTACRNSPDYFNECDWVTGNQSTPNNLLGFQYAQDGNAYAGFISYSLNGVDYREHLICSLLQPLIINKKYFISYYISLANNYSGISTNNQGVLFSTVNYNSLIWSPITNYCHVYATNVMTDTLNWMLVQGTFIADSNYSHLIIGNFFNDFYTDTNYTPPASHSYYFIDNIKVIEDTSLNINNENLKTNISLYPNPTKNIVEITADNYPVNSIKLYDISGQLMFSSMDKFTLKYFKLDLYFLKPGMYILNITNDQNISTPFKLVKL